MIKHKGYNKINREQIEQLYNEALDDTNKSFIFPDGTEIKYSTIFKHYKPSEYYDGFFNYCEAENIMVCEDGFFEKSED